MTFESLKTAESNVVDFKKYHCERVAKLEEHKQEQITRAVGRSRSKIEFLFQWHATKTYHNIEHTQMVAHTSSEIAHGLVTNEEDIDLEPRQKFDRLQLIQAATHYAAFIHDAVVEAEFDGAFTKRKRGWKYVADTTEYGNEYKSFILGMKYLLMQYPDSEITENSSDDEVLDAHAQKKKVDATYDYFTDEVEDGVRATYPEVKFAHAFPEDTDFRIYDEVSDSRIDIGRYLDDGTGVKRGILAYQEHILSSPPPPSFTGLSIGLTDIGACGYADDPTRYFAVGDKELLESNTLLAKNFYAALRGDWDTDRAWNSNISEKITGEFKKWFKDQIGFAMWFKVYLKHMRANHPAITSDKQRQYLDHKFRFLDRNILATVKRMQDFNALVGDDAFTQAPSAREQSAIILDFLHIGKNNNAKSAMVSNANAYAENLPLAA